MMIFSDALVSNSNEDLHKLVVKSQSWYSKCNFHFNYSQWLIHKGKDQHPTLVASSSQFWMPLYFLPHVVDLSVVAQQLFFTNWLLKKKNSSIESKNTALETFRVINFLYGYFMWAILCCCTLDPFISSFPEIFFIGKIYKRCCSTLSSALRKCDLPFLSTKVITS